MSLRESIRSIITAEVSRQSVVTARIETVASVHPGYLGLARAGNTEWNVPYGYTNPEVGDRVLVLLARPGPVAVCRLTQGVND